MKVLQWSTQAKRCGHGPEPLFAYALNQAFGWQDDNTLGIYYDKIIRHSEYIRGRYCVDHTFIMGRGLTKNKK